MVGGVSDSWVGQVCCKTRQDKRLHLFQPAWLIRCLIHRLDQFAVTPRQGTYGSETLVRILVDMRLCFMEAGIPADKYGLDMMMGWDHDRGMR